MRNRLSTVLIRCKLQKYYFEKTTIAKN